MNSLPLIYGLIGAFALMTLRVKSTPSDILIRLSVVAAVTLILWWFPFDHVTKYQGNSDDRSEWTLALALQVCPFGWVVGAICLSQVFGREWVLSPAKLWGFRGASGLLFLVIISSLFGWPRKLLHWTIVLH